MNTTIKEEFDGGNGRFYDYSKIEKKNLIVLKPIEITKSSGFKKIFYNKKKYGLVN